MSTLGHDVATAPVRRLGPADVPACLALSLDRKWLAEERKWHLLLDVGEVYGIDSPDGGLAGTVASTPFGRDIATIGMMLVANRHERRGLGGRLMAHALERAGTASAWLTATDYGRPLYERLGFRAIGECVTYFGQFRNSATPRKEASRPALPSDLAGIIALDADAFGTSRDHVLSRLQTPSEPFRVVDSPSGIAGYGLAWRSGESTILGPVVAENADVALSLLSDLASDVEGPLRVVLDPRHPRLTEWAGAHGLTRGSPNALMVRGEPPAGKSERIFALIMQALG